MRRFIFLYLVCLLFCVNAMGAQKSDHWVGTLQGKDRAEPIRFDFQQNDSGVSGTVFAPSEKLMMTPITKAERDGDLLSFTAGNGSVEYQFQATISENALHGSMKSGDARIPFDMVLLAPVVNETYFGTYKTDHGKNIYIRTWDELGSNQLTYFDDAGRVGPLYATSDQSFFSGPSLMVPMPKQAEIIFHFDSKSQVIGFTWKEAGKEIIAKKNTAIQEEDVTFRNGNVTLAASLVLPEGKSPFPAVVLVHGSGPVTRDFFGPIAYVLASHGIAVLSYDKRGIGESGGDWLEADFEDLAEDALAGIQYLKSRKEIRNQNIGLLGISQGGWIIPIAASKSSDVAFAVLISAPAVSPARQDETRVHEEMSLSGATKEEIEKTMAGYKEQIDGLMSEEGLKWVQGEIQKAKNAGKTQLLSSGESNNPRFLLWLRSILAYDPLPALARVKCPVLAIYGELDRGVPVTENKTILETALKNAGNNKLQVTILPRADHALLECKTGRAAEFPYLNQFAPGFFDSITDWILKNSQ